MFGKKKQYDKIFFKLILFAVYSVFFTVQIFLRFTSPQSQQSLGQDNYQKTFAFKPDARKNIFPENTATKITTSVYLNKHYHPKDVVILPFQDLELKYIYFDFPASYAFTNAQFSGNRIGTTSLRGPPAML